MVTMEYLVDFYFRKTGQDEGKPLTRIHEFPVIIAHRTDKIVKVC